ncbi:MAG: protein kinase, partial [Chloroflexota bacterium]|nr:protein kinase [Chloroflexota bacterium]
MDTRLGRVVAIKLLRETYAHDPSFTARFENEARAAARLSHPNIVDVYDYDSSDGRYFIAMEYVSGRNLKEAINADAPFEAAQAVGMLGPILSGLGAAHEAGLVHRDMKPQNVLVGPDGVPKIADFGIAKAMGDAGMTEAGIAFGTPHYLAPEQARGDAVSPRTDLYAVGVMLYEMLSGRLPFEGENPMRVAYAHVFDEARPLVEVAPGVGGELATVVSRAMAKDPQERYGTAEEMLRALNNADTASVPALATTTLPAAVAGAGAPTVSMPVVRTASAQESRTSRAVTIAGPSRTAQYNHAPRRGRQGLLWLVPVLLTGFLVGCLLLGSRLDGLNGSSAGLATGTPASTGVPTVTGVATAIATSVPSPTAAPSTATMAPTATAAPLPTMPAARPSATAPKATVSPTVIRRPVQPTRFTARAFSGTV